MTVVFNPPPGWPSPPPGWQVPAGWRPDPSWPAPPPGWPFWVDDQPQARRRMAAGTGAAGPMAAGTVASPVALSVAMAGGLAVAAGALLPWVTFDSAGLDIKPAARIGAAIVGALLFALALRVRLSNRPGRSVAGIFAVIISALASFAYSGFILIGQHGIPSEDDLGNPVTIVFHPNIGIVLMAAGSWVFFVAMIAAARARRSRAIR
jgi:hypothetical protein